ncbi:MAG: GDSL-type esterase/lipase family protein [Bacteroidota bacterium]|nr:GDSL-type esterase/lipase family protein [Bacteroidota bacterium]
MSIIYTRISACNLLCVLLILTMIPLQSSAQDEYPVPASMPTIIRQDVNRIQNPMAINRFMTKLRNLENKDSVNVKILHVGDSHIYADLMTGMVRQLFQKRFGAGCPRQYYRYKLSEFQDSLQTSFITPLPGDSIRKSGICYFMAGANGAEFSTYNQKPEFFKEAALLHPDLVIISMGTNEAFGYLDQNIFENNIDAFVSQIRWYNPGADILITTPADAMKKKRYHNPNIEKVCSILTNYASNSNTAIWDLNAVMGGSGSMKKWYTLGLSQKDKVHFSKEGYFLQGYLLFNALMNELDKPATER